MKKIILILTIFILFLFNINSLYAAVSGKLQTTVSGTVGEIYLNLSGYASPYASIAISSGGIMLRATTADENGYFSIKNILINETIKQICFDTIDFERLGSSYVCISINPNSRLINIDNIFLPPTIGLTRDKIEAGGTTIAHGYTMPGAVVTLHFGNKTYKIKADESGFYEFILRNIEAGLYDLYATANFENNPSLDPERKLKLQSYSKGQQSINWLKELWDKFWKFITSLPLGPLWFIFPLLIPIFILISKLWPGKLTFIFTGKFIFFIIEGLRRHKKPLHHEWLFGY